MAYPKTTWVDRAVQYPNRYTKSGESANEVTLVAKPGTVTQAGTPLAAAPLNKIEQGIFDAAAQADVAFSMASTRIDISDANLMTVNGKYYLWDGANKPDSSMFGFFFDVSKFDEDHLIQRAQCLQNNRVWTRAKASGVWQAWTLISNEMTNLATATNLNTLVVDGWFHATTATNAPINGINYFVQVSRYPLGNYTVQNAYSPEGNRTWTRRQVNGVWSVWDELYTSSTYVPHVTGTYTGNGAVSRDIALPFTPSAVLVMRQYPSLVNIGGTGGHASGGLAVTGSPVGYNDGTFYPAITVGANKFTVVYGTDTNNGQNTNLSGSVYNYIAFR